MKHVRACLTKIDPIYPFKTIFYDEILQQTYERELKISNLITLFSVIAIFISIVGVFGLVVFESEYRRKEVAVRKVLGSSTSQILVMFNRSYLIILAACFVLATPVAFYGMYRWLENFAYRTPMYWWVFLLAFVIICVHVLYCTFLDHALYGNVHGGILSGSGWGTGLQTARRWNC